VTFKMFSITVLLTVGVVAVWITVYNFAAYKNLFGQRLHKTSGWAGTVNGLLMFCVVQWAPQTAWPYALAVVAVISLIGWTSDYRRAREMDDLPTSQVASAAQGYVELLGRAEPLPDAPKVSPVSGQPCCWCVYVKYEKESLYKWRLVDWGGIGERFLLIDDSGTCEIISEGADVLTNVHRKWREGRFRYEESLLPPGSLLYAIGQFATVGGAAGPQRRESEYVSALTGIWKKDPEKLKARFDTNRDGVVDLVEWAAARKEAKRVVRERLAAPPAAREEAHTLSRPPDGRLFLLASAMPDGVRWRYSLASLLHVVVFFSASVLALVMVLTPR
jgi:hypothetical protein